MKPNILIDELPKSVVVDGKSYAIEWNFRAAILFELLMNDADYSAEEKIVQSLALYYPEGIPENIEKALNALIDFYLCGEEIKSTKKVGKQKINQKSNYSFEQDATYIYAAFFSQYGIDLNSIESLHWWKFSALFRSLGDDQKISQIMYYRDVDLKGKSKGEKKFLKAMKEKYALKEYAQPHQKLTLAQRDAAMKAYVKKRFEEIKGSV